MLLICIQMANMDLIALLGFAAALCTTLSFVPQAIRIIRTKNTSSISLWMYALFTLGVFLWLLYGIFSKNSPVIVANAITFIFCSIILLLKIKYK
jgi:MtN3 and saliva related transmembrane protein